MAVRWTDTVVLITGASSGIGEAVARKVARRGATAVLVARRAEELTRVQESIRAEGGVAHCYVCDLTDLEAIDRTATRIEADLGRVDVLINNAGRSIRRSLMESLDRFHDFERTMQLNYFGAVRLVTRLMPGMIERRQGHIINISTMGVLVNSPRFSAYIASKAALDAFSRCVATEVLNRGVHFTAVHMPLVDTPMIAPSKAVYGRAPKLTTDQAAAMVLRAMTHKPKTVTTPLGKFVRLSYALTPHTSDTVLNLGFRMLSAAPRGDHSRSRRKQKPHRAALSYLLRGVRI